jgi:hypothetical protein
MTPWSDDTRRRFLSARPLIFDTGGLVLLVAAAATISATVGLIMAGIACLYLGWRIDQQ